MVIEGCRVRIWSLFVYSTPQLIRWLWHGGTNQVKGHYLKTLLTHWLNQGEREIHVYGAYRIYLKKSYNYTVIGRLENSEQEITRGLLFGVVQSFRDRQIFSSLWFPRQINIICSWLCYYSNPFHVVWNWSPWRQFGDGEMTLTPAVQSGWVHGSLGASNALLPIILSPTRASTSGVMFAFFNVYTPRERLLPWVKQNECFENAWDWYLLDSDSILGI